MQQPNNTGTVLSDEKIIELYFRRNEQAITATDIKYGNYLKVIGYNILKDIWDSEECLNDTYHSTWNKIPPARPSIFQAFLSKIMRDVSISRYRKKNAEKRVPSELVVSLEELEEAIAMGASTEEDRAIKIISDILNEFLSEMSKRERFVFICRYYYCDKVEYIAKMLCTSEKTVYRDIEKLKTTLKEKLREENVEI